MQLQVRKKWGYLLVHGKRPFLTVLSHTTFNVPNVSVHSFISGKIGDISKLTKITSKIYAKLSTWLLVKLTQNRRALQKKSLKVATLHYGLRPAFGRPWPSLRSARNYSLK